MFYDSSFTSSIDKVNNVFTRARCASVVTCDLFSCIIIPTDWIELLLARETVHCNSWITKHSILGVILALTRSCESCVLCLARLAVTFSCSPHDLSTVIPYPTECFREVITGEGDFFFFSAEIYFPS